MKLSFDIDPVGLSVVCDNGIDRFYLQNGNHRAVFTTDGEYIYTYNYVNPIWE